MAILGSIKPADLEGMSSSIPEGAKKLLRDIGAMKKKKIYDLLPRGVGYDSVSYSFSHFSLISKKRQISSRRC
jgi:hypothetical protein